MAVALWSLAPIYVQEVWDLLSLEISRLLITNRRRRDYSSIPLSINFTPSWVLIASSTMSALMSILECLKHLSLLMWLQLIKPCRGQEETCYTLVALMLLGTQINCTMSFSETSRGIQAPTSRSRSDAAKDSRSLNTLAVSVYGNLPTLSYRLSMPTRVSDSSYEMMRLSPKEKQFTFKSLCCTQISTEREE